MPISEFIASYGFFLLQNLLVASVAVALVRIFHESTLKSEKIILVSLYFVSTIIVVMTLLGALRMLNYGAFLGVLAILNLIIIPIAWKKKYGAALKVAPFGRVNEVAELRLGLLFAPLLILLIVKFINASLSAVTETDSLVYHLPFAVQWYQTQSIWEPYYTAYAGPLGYYPGNYEFLSLFAFFPFKRDILVNLVNFTLFIPFSLVLIGLGQLFGLKKMHAAVAATLFLFTPLIIRQGGIPQNDLFFIFALGVAAYWGIKAHLHKEWNFGTIVPLSLGLGLFIGTKSSGIIYGSLILLIIAVLLRKKPVHIIIMMLTAFAAGGFWYLRNWIYTGNPLFPMDVTINGTTIFKGFASFTERLKDSTLLAHLNFETFREVAKNAFLSTGIIGVIGFAAWVRGWFSKKVPRILLAVVPVFLGLYIITPFSFANIYPNIRYLLPFFLLGYLLFCMTWKGKRSHALYVLALGNFLLIAWQKYFLPYINDRVFIDIKEIFTHSYLLVLLCMILIFGAFLCFSKNRRTAVSSSLAVILSLGIFLKIAFPIREQNMRKSFAPHGQYIYNEKILEAFEYVDRNLPKNASIAFTRGPAHYPLFGEHWERRVHYVNINECFHCIYHNYADSPKSILRGPNYDHWISNLERARKDYLFIGQKVFEGIPPYELDWANEHPRKFQLLFENNHSFLYKINR